MRTGHAMRYALMLLMLVAATPTWADETLTVNFAITPCGDPICPFTHKGAGLLESVGVSALAPRFFVPDNVLSQLNLKNAKTSDLVYLGTQALRLEMYNRYINLGFTFVQGDMSARFNGCGEGCGGPANGGFPGGNPGWPLSRGWPCDDYNVATQECPIWEGLLTQYFQQDQADGLTNPAYDMWGEPD